MSCISSNLTKVYEDFFGQCCQDVNLKIKHIIVGV